MWDAFDGFCFAAPAVSAWEGRKHDWIGITGNIHHMD
jgi:hypothetical protein